jgi:hypothetical protein
VNIFSKRNALVGFLTLKALERRRSRRQLLRSKGPKIALVGLVSLGLVAAIAAVLMRRHHGEQEQIESLMSEDEGEIVGEYVTANPEPFPAT